VIHDIEGDPALILKVEQARELSLYGGTIFRSVAAAMGVIAFVASLMFVLAMNRVVLSRVDELARCARQVGETGDLSVRVPVRGGDELAELAGALNVMLSDLQRAGNTLRQRERCLHGLAQAAQALLSPSLGVPSESFLEPLGLAADASRAHVFLNHRGKSGELVISQVAEWCAEGIEPQMENPDLQQMPVVAAGFERWADVLERGEAINAIVAELPACERPVLESQGVKAVLVLPVMLDGKSVGMLGFDRCTEARKWSAPEADMLRAAAADLAQALRHSRADRLQAATYRISEVAQSVESLEELYRAVHEIIGELMPANNFYIALYDRASKMVYFPYFVDEHDERPEPKEMGRGLTEYVLRTGEALLASPEVFEELEGAGEVESVGAPSIDWLGVPLQLRGETIGVLAVQGYAEGIRLTEREEGILSFVSAQVAMAIERVRAEEELRESETRYRTIFETTANATVLIEEDTTLSLVNREFEALSGYAREEVEGKKSWTEFVVPEDLERMREHHRVRREPGEGAPRNYDFRFVDRQGNVRDVFLTIAMVPGTTKSVASLLDITERKQAEDELRQLKEFNEGIVRGVAEALLIEDADGMITFINPAMEELLGHRAEEMVGSHWHKIVPEEERAHVESEVAQRPMGSEGRYETRLLSKDGREIPVLVNARVLFEDGSFFGVLSAFTDISQLKQAEEARKELEAQLRQAQKMEAVGLLAGGVAHEFNNMLTVILGNAEWSLLQEEVSRPLHRELSAIQRTAERAARLTQHLLAFSRRQMLQLGPVDLNELLQGFCEMLERLIGEHIKLELQLEAELGMVYADGSSLEQALMNLALNARDAMPQGGRLRFETANVEVDEEYCETHAEAEPGEYVRVTVLDTGMGMDEATQKHLFEPFFTTKEVGEGTGLGLPMVYGVVKQHHGWIEAKSAVEEGTRFDLYLPRMEGERGEGKGERGKRET